NISTASMVLTRVYRPGNREMRHCNGMSRPKDLQKRRVPTKLMTFALLLFAAFLSHRNLPAQQPANDPVLRWMDQLAQQQLQSREDAIARIHSVADAERRKQWVRETFLSLIGGLPDYTGPLNARTTGRIQAENYSIEKIIFES